jgi:hypothetical protein
MDLIRGASQPGVTKISGCNLHLVANCLASNPNAMNFSISDVRDVDGQSVSKHFVNKDWNSYVETCYLGLLLSILGDMLENYSDGRT